MKYTIKVAELASIIYAFLVFGSLLINMAYYGPFNISIISYMNLGDILMLFLNTPILYIPNFVFIITYFLTDLFYLNKSVRKIGEKEIFLIDIYTKIFILSASTLYICNSYYNLNSFKESSDIVIICLMVLFACSIILPSPFIYIAKCIGRGWDLIIDMSLEGFANFCKYINIPIEMCNKTRISILKNRYLRHKSYIQKINLLYSNKYLYFILLIYIFTITNACLINQARALTYISGTQIPQEQYCITSNNHIINTDGSKYLPIGECTNYVFVYDKEYHNTIIINRKDIYKFTIKHLNKSTPN